MHSSHSEQILPQGFGKSAFIHVRQFPAVNPGHVQKKGIIAAGMGQKIGEAVPVLREIRRRAFRRLSPGERIPLELIQNPLGILRIAPGDEIVLVAELAVKSRLGIAAVFDDLLFTVILSIAFSIASSRNESARISFAVFRFMLFLSLQMRLLYQTGFMHVLPVK